MDGKSLATFIFSIAMFIVGCIYSGIFMLNNTLITYIVGGGILFFTFLFTYLCLSLLFKKD